MQHLSSVKCAEITSTSGGSFNITSDGQVSSVAHTCEPGFTLKGQSTATCLQTLQWDQIEPECGMFMKLGHSIWVIIKKWSNPERQNEKK